MKPNKSEPTKTVLTIAVGFIVIFILTKWDWAIFVSLVIGLIGIFSTYLSLKINYLWLKLTWFLSLIIPNIILGLVFYLFLTPYSFLLRLFINKDTLVLKNKNESIFRDKKKQFNKDSFQNPW